MSASGWAGVEASPGVLPTRRAEWGSVSELWRPDYEIRQIRVFAPGTTRRERRLLDAADLSPALGAAAGVLVAAVLSAPPIVLAALLFGGGLVAWTILRRATSRIRRRVRVLTVTTWADETHESEEQVLMARCIALADAIDDGAPRTAVERELLWGTLYFLLPAPRRAARRVHHLAR